MRKKEGRIVSSLLDLPHHFSDMDCDAIAEDPMLIGVDASRAFVPELTGTEHYSLHVIHALIRTRGANRLRLYTRAQPPNEFLHEIASTESAEVVVLPFPRMWTHLRLAHALWCQPPDVLFVPAHVLPAICRVPSVVTVHDLGYLHLPDTHPVSERWYLDWTTRRHTRVAERLIADSEATRTDLIQCYNAEPSKIRVIHPGRDESLIPVASRDEIVRTTLRYQIEGDYLLYLGTLRPRKNLARLIEAFAQAKPALPTHLSLVLAGKGSPYANELRQLAASLGLSNSIVFTGYIRGEDKPALLTGAAGLVFPSLYEGFGLPLLEAMSCRVPVLTSDVSSLPEVAGNAAILVDPFCISHIAEGIERLVNDTDLRQHLIEAGTEQVRKFSWNAAAIQLWDVFSEVHSLRGSQHG
jgi:glycosyltransferase involved in cell wall biosynthesis